MTESTESEGFLDRAPPSSESGAHDALEPTGEVAFADAADGSTGPPAPPPTEPAPAPTAGPAWQLSRAPGTSAHPLGTLGRVALPERAATPAPAATTPCPTCQKPVPEGHARCTFCGKPLVKKEVSPLEDFGSAPGSPIVVATPAERVVGASYVPAALQQELAARDDLIAVERARLLEAKRAKRRWVLRWAPLLLATPWLIIWVLALGSWSATVLVLFVVDLVASWAVVRWSIARGGGTAPTVGAAAGWALVKVSVGLAKLGAAFVALALVPSLFTLALAAGIGVSIELEADELR